MQLRVRLDSSGTFVLDPAWTFPGSPCLDLLSAGPLLGPLLPGPSGPPLHPDPQPLLSGVLAACFHVVDILAPDAPGPSLLTVLDLCLFFMPDPRLDPVSLFLSDERSDAAVVGSGNNNKAMGKSPFLTF